ncbi:MAG TPA: sporulation protein YqfD, partial [Bacilli bacterium]|nr:sporulation protein YqfD [Bacilli bacterium]
MLGRWLLDFWKGYVQITLRGAQIPELINRATRQGIVLWDIRQLKTGDYRARIRREQIRPFVLLLRQTGTKIHFERKFGVPFLTWRASRRKFFLAGALTFLIALYALTSLVWNVDVEGDLKHVSPETIEQAASEIGIYQGAWKGKLPDTDILQEQLLDKVPQLAFAGIQFQGTHVKIQVVEKVPGVEPQPTAPQNIVATKTGTIQDIFVHKGKATVVRNQYVQAGQVLISGALPDGQTYVHATGDVTAKVWYKTTVNVPLAGQRNAYTGNTVEKHFLTFWGHPIQIWGYGKIPYKELEEQPEDSELSIGDYLFPIQYRHTVYREVHKEAYKLTEDEAVRKGFALAKADVVSKMGKGGKLLQQKVLQKVIKDGNLELQVLNIAVENIGKPQGLV